ncbi:MAG: carboxypeptidase-like regulatory domain-containing protein [candidate division KSB1 bacterium]|nr:carboxypeptidase-like regulatory domain-containing protein [candidate division KSB1 bacterium]MDZ7300960.1 carboxypeptidase-like regulatory domain-containing protein [candidate division KSB1 bacterium]MDZ7310362.1 carboxypeptidase-like regulatory domain-containing protein [candidate division KSB1 bacterium]
MKRLLLLAFIALVLLPQLILAGTTGKIAGTVTDADNGEPLPGVNVILEGTTIGAATNIDGYYVILNVPPGTYTLRASYIGYANYRVTEVVVKIDLTTTIDFKMKPEVLAGEEVVVVAQRPVVVKDISASQANLNIKEVESLPVVSVASVVGLQAGVRGLEIRGGGSEQTAFVVNGITLRDERNNTPYTAISYTAIEEIQIQTGGFNAEFGNIRSGLVNVVTKEGKKDRYSVNMLSRYSPPTQKHFGPAPHDRNSYWIRPYVDDAVCWTGTTSGAWDVYTQKQYQEFEGWNSIALKTLKDTDPTNDLTPEAAQRLFLWQHRRALDIVDPDYDFDMSVGGPLPLLGERLGNLRFLASYRTTQEMYVVPLSKDGYRDYSAQLKVTADVASGMKLVVEGIRGRSVGTNDNNAGLPGIFRSAESIAEVMTRVSYIDTRMFATDYWAPTAITRTSIGAKFTHVLSPSTFYEATLSRFKSEYETHPGRPRDRSPIYLFGNSYYVDEAPFGFEPRPAFGIGSGMRSGVGMSNSRDSSKVTVYSAKVDFSSQLDRYNQIKTGVEFIYTDNNVNYASVDEFLPSGRSRSKWHTYPVRGALYVQDKLEFEGMIANLGLRLDYSHAGGEWYTYDPYNKAFTSERSLGIDTLLQKEPTKRIFNLSPRLGVAFPITVNSKLYFNYGHFRQMPTPENLYLIRRYSDNNQVTRVANPNNPLPKTVAYELGYEQNLADQFLIRLAGYYKDVSLQSRLVTYTSRDTKVNYSVTEPNNYEDIRGFELTVSKNRGDWVQGFVNYTYQVSTAGNFGFSQYYENPADQRRYERETRSQYQEKPVPRPYARANLYFFTPVAFGPKVAGFYPLEDIRLNILGAWRSGFHFTWAGGGSIPGIVNNVQWRDTYGLDLRLSKTLKLAGANIQFFMDVNNALNLKQMNASPSYIGYGFFDAKDYDAYMKSLHLPKDIGDPLGYGNIPGNDRPGDYRKSGVAFVPIEFAASAASLPATPPKIEPGRRLLYYVKDAGSYMEYVNGAWQQADQGFVDRVLKDKAYIDMPNQEYFTFLNPRDVFFGVNVTFDIF